MKSCWKYLRIAAAGFALASTGVHAQEVTLKIQSAFPENLIYTTHVVPWMKQFNVEGKGIVQLNFIGGPQSIPTFEVGNAVKTGVLDMEQRKNGAHEYINRVWNDKANMVYLARYIEHLQYHAYLNKKIDKPDLRGLKLRSHPAYRDYFQSLGATVMSIAPGELYTALERGVLDGYGFPNLGIFELNLQEKTKYRIDPGFYDVEGGIIVNLDRWKKLTPAQRDFMQKQALKLEAMNGQWKGYADEEMAKQAKAGIQVIRFDPAAMKQYYDKAYELGWTNFIKASPVHGPKMRQLFSKAL
jgi:TRAP-type transport system periplasmic protein